MFILFSAALLLCWSVILSPSALLRAGLSKEASAATVSLPATGQTKCYNTAGAEIACAGTGQDGDKKMGVAWPNPRFTVSGDCVTDNLTGLLWAKNANLPNGNKLWQEALAYVASLNTSGGLCGYTDWRLPQILELESLVHVGYNNETCGASACSSNAAWLDAQGFINAQSGFYWSSSTYSNLANYVWNVNMYDGGVNVSNKTYSLYVWPVRGGQ